MGGGDLNLKKSWHPQTLKNQEKVWKAEQAEKSEKRKLDELRKEIAEEKSREDLKKLGQSSGVLSPNENPKLEWMYKGPTDLLNREEYLLGRSIDKSFEQLDAEEKTEKEKQVVGVTVPKNHVEHECIPFSIRQYRSVQSTEQVDLQRKVMEDPLMLIKQKELESRRKILENPVKLKELHRLLKSEKAVSVGKKSKKQKKKQKKKKSKQSSDDGSDEELDKMLAKQYKKIQNALNADEDACKLDISKLLNVKYEKLSKELDRAAKSKKKSKKRSTSSESSSSREAYTRSQGMHPDRHASFSASSKNRSSYESGRSRLKNIHRRDPRSRSRSDDRSPSRCRDRRYNRREEFSNPPRRSYDKRFDEIGRRRDDRRPDEKSCGEGSSRSNKKSEKKKLTEEEKESLRREMMQNAVVRDEERTRSVKKYREEYDKERKQHEANEFDKTFINKELQKAMSNQKSMESRIKSNINNIQRSARAMDSNFAKR